MPADLLQTKLFAPRLRPSLVHRPRLIEKLNNGLSGKLTLVSAPAGFGKTTVVAGSQACSRQRWRCANRQMWINLSTPLPAANGVTVIRQTDEGLSIVADGYGRTLATGEGLADDSNYLPVDVPTSSPTTRFPVIGNLVGILAAAAFIALAGYAWLMGHRQQDEVPQTAVATS